MKRERPSPVPGGAAIFQRLYTRLGCRGRPPRFEVEFYPYANLMHTIRIREETACVRLSDALRGVAVPLLGVGSYELKLNAESRGFALASRSVSGCRPKRHSIIFRMDV